jgi:hypothetical protein
MIAASQYEPEPLVLVAAESAATRFHGPAVRRRRTTKCKF